MTRNALLMSLTGAIIVIAVGAGCTLNTRPDVGNGSNGVCTAPDGSLQPCDAGTPSVSSSAGGGEGQAGSTAVSRNGVSGATAAGGSGGMSAVAGGSPAGGAPGSGGVVAPPPPPPKNKDGTNCAVDSDCESNHCNGGLCCSSGNCCRTVSDCSKSIASGLPVQCNDPSTCQGSGGTPVCMNNRCMAMGGDPNDSACTNTTKASDCGHYKPVFCNGMVDQPAQTPACPTSCKSDADCDADSHCDITSQCVLDAANGSACTMDHDCTSSHCGNGVCCASGDCCAIPELQCSQYFLPATCDSPTTCQGTRKTGVCTNFQCAQTTVEDDSGCSGQLASACGLFKDFVCSDKTVQPVGAACQTSCTVDSQCDANAFCNIMGSGMAGTCATKRQDGQACSAQSQCQNGACSNGFCCGDTSVSTSCCNVSSDCPAKPPMCTNAMNCTGTSYTASCTTAHTCRYDSAGSTDACNGMMHTCPTGFAHPSYTCPVGCKCSGTAGECSDGYQCVNGTCVMNPTAGTGGPAAGTGGVSGGSGMGMGGTGGPAPSGGMMNAPASP